MLKEFSLSSLSLQATIRMSSIPIEIENLSNASNLSTSSITPAEDNAYSFSNTLDYISSMQSHLISLIVNCTLCLSICVLGMLANIVNLSVFTKQKFGDSMTVNLTGLAVADFASLLFLFWRDVLYIPQIEDSLLPVDPLPFMYMTGGWPHVYFTRVSSWITAFITFERCLCIAMPLKVKTLITSRRVAFIHLAIYTLVFATIAPVYYTNQLVWKFYPEENRTLIGLSYAHDRNEIESFILPLQGNVLPLGALAVNIICTTILVVKLNYHRNWRLTQGTTGKRSKNSANNVSSKEARVIKMAVTISIIYIVCFGPLSVIVPWMTVDPEFRLDGKRKNSFIVTAAFTFLFEAFNSSVNIFVYYNMSSNFKATFLEMFRLKIR